MAEAGVRVAIDVGGTFTDIVISAVGELFTYKILSLPGELGVATDRCVRDAMERSRASSVDAIVHGTTVGSNAVLEGKGAATGLVCTRGFRDLLEVRDGRRPAVN